MTLCFAPGLSAGKKGNRGHKARGAVAPPTTETHHKLRVKLLQNSLQGAAECTEELDLLDAVDLVETKGGIKVYPLRLALGYRRPGPAPAREPASRPGSTFKGVINLKGQRPVVPVVRPNMIIQNGDFSGMNLAKDPTRSWAGSMISDCNLEGANLAGMDLRGTSFLDCRFKGAKWAGAKLFKASFVGCKDLDIRGAMLHPFFEPERGEGLATFKIYELPHGEFRTSAITCPDEGGVYVGSADHAQTWDLACTGSLRESSGDGKNSYWRVTAGQFQIRAWGQTLFNMDSELKQTLTLPGRKGPVMIGTFPAENAVAIDLGSSHRVHRLAALLPEGEAQRLRLRQCALGPDGNLWLTLGSSPEGGTIGAIGRLTLAGALTTWILPGGLVPEGIDAGKGPSAGRVFFTLEGRASLGCMSLPGPESGEEGKGEEKKEEKKTAEPPRRPSKPRRINDHDRRQAAFLRERGSASKDDSVWAVPHPGREPEEQDASRESKEERKIPAPQAPSTPPPRVAPPPPSVPDSIAALAALRVTLDLGQIDHIVKVHHFNSPYRDSQFEVAYSTWEGLAALLAEAMAEAGDMIGRVTEPRGKCVTRVALPRTVGYYYESSTGTWEPTSWVEVRMNRIGEGSGRIHDIRTAYPIQNPMNRR
ncbi:MAG: pentapeptide repeat-containing protein [Holophaga sp.]|nr:pentapeptide repeat-containing protein [Holophaga sp.]